MAFSGLLAALPTQLRPRNFRKPEMGEGLFRRGAGIAAWEQWGLEAASHQFRGCREAERHRPALRGGGHLCGQGLGQAQASRRRRAQVSTSHRPEAQGAFQRGWPGAEGGKQGEGGGEGGGRSYQRPFRHCQSDEDPVGGLRPGGLGTLGRPGGSHRGGRTPERGWSVCRPWGPGPSSPLTHPHCQEAKQREFFREDLGQTGEGPDLKGQQREKCLGRSRQQAEGLQPRGRRHPPPPTPGPGNEGAAPPLPGPLTEARGRKAGPQRVGEKMEGARAGGEDRRLFGRAAGGRERAPRDGRVFPVRSSQHAGKRRTEVERDPGRVTAGGGRGGGAGTHCSWE